MLVTLQCSDDNTNNTRQIVTRQQQQLRNRAFKANRCGATGVSMHNQSGLYRSRYKNKTTYHETLEAAAKSYQEMFANMV